MTTLKLLPLLLGLATACDQEAPRPQKTFDFSGGPLDAQLPAGGRPAGPLGKTAIRYAIVAVQPRLRACAHAVAGDPAGILEVRLRLAGGPELPTDVEAVELGGDSRLATSPDFITCAGAALASIELPAMAAAEVWDVHYPIVVSR